MLDHGFVQAGAIAVGRPVKHGRLKIVVQLDEAAPGAFHNFQRRTRERFAGVLRKDSGETLLAQVQDGVQFPRLANPAGVEGMIHFVKCLVELPCNCKQKSLVTLKPVKQVTFSINQPPDFTKFSDG